MAAMRKKLRRYRNFCRKHCVEIVLRFRAETISETCAETYAVHGAERCAVDRADDFAEHRADDFVEAEIRSVALLPLEIICVPL